MKIIKKIAMGILVALLCLSPVVCLLPMDRGELNLDADARYSFRIIADEGGTIPAGIADEISREYAPGDQITLIAREMEGFRFDCWTADAGRFDDAARADAVFTMPACDVVVKAVFKRLEL